MRYRCDYLHGEFLRILFYYFMVGRQSLKTILNILLIRIYYIK